MGLWRRGTYSSSHPPTFFPPCPSPGAEGGMKKCGGLKQITNLEEERPCDHSSATPDLMTIAYRW